MGTVELRNIHKSIKGHHVLQGIDLDVQVAEVVGIIGANGSGKTTLLRVICGLTKVDDGSIKILEEPISAKGNLPIGIGVVFDPPALLADLNGIQNLTTIAKIKNTMTNEEMISLLNKVGLKPSDKRRVSKYSQGMKKRLGLAIAMMEEPKLVLMDEPTNGLDPEGIASLRAWITDLKNTGASVIIVGHYIREMIAVCDRIFKMVEGKLFEIPIEEIPVQ